MGSEGGRGQRLTPPWSSDLQRPLPFLTQISSWTPQLRSPPGNRTVQFQWGRKCKRREKKQRKTTTTTTIRWAPWERSHTQTWTTQILETVAENGWCNVLVFFLVLFILISSLIFNSPSTTHCWPGSSSIAGIWQQVDVSKLTQSAKMLTERQKQRSKWCSNGAKIRIVPSRGSNTRISNPEI